MNEPKTIAEFEFVANRSFAKSSSSRPITIPSRLYQALKAHGLVESKPATITFRNGPPMKGAIRIGWRAGGRYYQIAVRSSEGNRELSNVTLGTNLRVRLLHSTDGWLVELL